MGAVVATSSARVIRAVGYAGALRAGDPNHAFLPREVEPEARTVIASDADANAAAEEAYRSIASDANAAAEERRVPLLRAMPMPICRCGSSFDAADRTLNSFGPSDTYARTSCAPCCASARGTHRGGLFCSDQQRDRYRSGAGIDRAPLGAPASRCIYPSTF